MKQNSKARCRSNELIAILRKFLVEKMNLAHTSFLGLFICALCKAQTVNFVKVAAHFELQAKSASSMRRIQ